MASVQKYILTQRPENSVKKTEYDLHVWKRLFLEMGEARKIEEIPADELNILICQFLIVIKKKDGGSYEPATLQSFQRSLQRYLNDKNSKLNILKDWEFLKSREVLLSKKKQLVFEEAKGNRPHAAKELSNAEEDFLFRTGKFGAENPEALQRTVWWLLALHFGFRARDESRKLKWGDIVLQTENETGKEFLIWKSERGSKTSRGNGDTRAFNPTALATNNERCPVFYYKEFKSHRPEEMNSADSPFYLAINYRRRPGSNSWWKQPRNQQACREVFSQPHCSKNLYISPDGCRGSRKLRRSIKRAQKFEEPQFLQSSVRRPSAENVLNFKPLRPRKYSSDIDSKRPRKRHFTSETSQRCQ